MMRGPFIVVEGIDGCGKSTQVKRVVEALEHLGFDVVTTRYPGGTPEGQVIRNLFKDETMSLDKLSAQLLLGGDMAQTRARVIEPALAAGRVVVSDRWGTVSSPAYSTAGEQNPPSWADDCTRIGSGDLRPDLVLLLDLTPEMAAERCAAERDGDGVKRYDQAPLAVRRRIRTAYHAMASQDLRGTWYIIDVNAPVEVVTTALVRLVVAYLTEHGVVPRPVFDVAGVM